MTHPFHVVIAGGGISGLATAHYLHRFAQTHNMPIRCSLLEGETRLGGKISTARLDIDDQTILIEGGPESFVTRKPWALALCSELGLDAQLMGADDAGRNYVLHQGKPVQVPHSPRGFLTTPLLSLPGKLRAAQEVFLPAHKTLGDESLGHLVRRRFGNEVLEKLVAPAVGSIYLSDVDQLSTQVSFDRFLKLEQRHGSVLRGMLALQRASKHASQTAAKPAVGQAAGQTASPQKPPPFVTLRGGLGDLIDALAHDLRRAGGQIRTGTYVTGIHRPSPGGINGPALEISTAGGEDLVADAVVLAVPAFTMADLIAPHDTESAAALRQVHYVDVATICLVYRRADVPSGFDGFGVVVPAREAPPLLACEVLSNKWPGRTPEGYVLLRAFAGGYRDEALVIQPDEALVTLAHRELTRIFGIRAMCVGSRVYRWQPGNPQYPVGHLDALVQAEARLKQLLPSVFLTGAALRGLGIPDCVHQAKDTATHLIDWLGQSREPQAQHRASETAPQPKTTVTG